MSKVLCIYPKDKTTEFLEPLFDDICKRFSAVPLLGDPQDDDDYRPETPSSDLNAEQQIIRQEQIAQLRIAIGHLKSEQRTALVLYAFEDLSYQQIADVMQCSLSKVESLIFRAKKNLAKEVKR